MNRKKILVCDDDRDMLNLLTTVLNQSGYDTVISDTGTGLDEMITIHRPDMVLLDIWIPDIIGTQLLTDMRMRPDGRMMPVIMMSAGPQGADIALAAGATAFIGKPFATEALEKIIGQHMKS